MEMAAACFSPAVGGCWSTFPAWLLCGEEGNDSSSKKPLGNDPEQHEHRRTCACTHRLHLCVFSGCRFSRGECVCCESPARGAEVIYRKPSGIEDIIITCYRLLITPSPYHSCLHSWSLSVNLNLHIYIHTCQINGSFGCNQVKLDW